MTTEPIVGYRQLSAATVDLINEIKNNANGLGYMLDVLAQDQEVDQRWLAIARTDLQKGFMSLIRAIARPDSF
jgi:hypothetical protein